MADAQPMALQAHFPPTSRDAWLRAATQALRGRSLDSLTQRTLEGLVRAPLYDTPAPDDAPAPNDARIATESTLASPYLRDEAALNRRMVGWDIRVHLDAGTALEAGHVAAVETAGAARSVWITPATPQRPGVVLDSVSALTALVAQLDVAATPIAIDVGALAHPWLTSLVAAVEATGFGADDLTGALRTDIAGTFATEGALPCSLAGCYDDLAATFKDAETQAPWLHLVAASGLPAHDAGADAAWSLAFALTSALGTFRALAERGLSPTDVARRAELTLGTHSDQFLTIASLRAARLLWAKLLAGLGVTDADRHTFLHAVTGWTTTAAQAPWTNMLRGTEEAAAAAMAGADAITLTPFDAALGDSDAQARQIARNAQLILAREGHLGRVTDPAGGSAYVERLTDGVARLAWRHLQTIERAGGLIAALESGLVQQAIAATVAERTHRIVSGQQVLVGVNKFVQADEPVLIRPQPKPSSSPLAHPGRTERDRVGADAGPTCVPLRRYSDAAAWIVAQTHQADATGSRDAHGTTAEDRT